MIPKNAIELIERARTALGRKIIYRLGKGGRRPKNETPADSENGCDCSGYVAWCLGFDRYIEEPFYARRNGDDGVKGWFETSAAAADAVDKAGILTVIDAPVPGCIAVYGDSGGSEGHIGIVTEVNSKGKATKVIHCSSSAYKKHGDAIAENDSTALLDNPRRVYAWFEGLVGKPGEDDFFAAGPKFFTEAAFATAPLSEKLVSRFDYIHQGFLKYRAWAFDGEAPFFFQRGVAICADGAPDAYKVGDLGTDYLANAGAPPFKGAPTDKNLDQWNWWGIVVDSENRPVKQDNTQPSPGYFVSKTAHGYWNEYSLTDQRCYVNANEIPYVVLPKGKTGSARLGDFAFLVNRKTGLTAPAIYSEVGPATGLGEVSVKLADMLQLPSNPRKGGSSKKDFLYLVFPGSGDGKPRPFKTIEKESTHLFQKWGGMARVNALPDLS